MGTTTVSFSRHDGLAIPPALDNPDPSAVKRNQKWAAKIDWDKFGKKAEPGRREIPGLDMAQLQTKYGPDRAYWPREWTATFRVPIGATQTQYERIKYDAIRHWLDHMDRDGWQFRSEYRISVYPGVYPAFDLRDRVALLDEREMMAVAFFVKREPETIRLELEPDDIAPYVVRE